MTFTNANPTFPYQSSQAARQLGIPDPAEIHLAITRLAESLIPLATGASLSDSDIKIAALRTASCGVLFSYSFDMVVIRFHASLGLPVDQNAIAEAEKLPRKDWLAEAVQHLKADGIRNTTEFRQTSEPIRLAALTWVTDKNGQSADLSCSCAAHFSVRPF